ncbi:MAG TPA: flagellar export chaperone FliS [Vicinamibacterales bacterium]|nr:flagellar export chaperone FliS [Vicinamibacterales bacterium]
MTPNRSVQSYKQTQTNSSSPLELVVLLYDGAIKFMGEARSAAERRDIRARRQSLDRALAIVAELQGTLNLDGGGDLAKELDRLYNYITDCLMRGAMNNDARAIGEAQRLFENLREGWRGIAAAQAGSAA